MLELAANGTALDAGQAVLVRDMCLRRAAAARDRTRRRREDHRHARPHLAWTQDGGQVIGLAPSAAAAAVLAEQSGIPADTLAKLTWSINHDDLPVWAARIGPSTLVIIDEAGMADTCPSTPPSSSPSAEAPASG